MAFLRLARGSLAAVAFTVIAPLALAQQPALNLSDGPRVDASQAPDSFAPLATRLMPAVVNIATSRAVATGNFELGEDDPLRRFNPFFGRGGEDGFRREGALGSGFVISSDGLVVTNYHVIENADDIDVNFSDGRVLRAEIVGLDQETDLAVLRVSSEAPLPFVQFADSDSADVGDWVMAIGNPFGFGGSVSIGVVSAKEREIRSGRYDDFIQTDAAINTGNSGGPLFTLSGEVLGVNTAIISPSGGSVGIGFSIPSNQAKFITDTLIDKGEVRRGWFGVDVQEVDEGLAESYNRGSTDGVIVTGLNDDSPAAEADFRVGDMLVTLDGEPIKNSRTLSRLIANAGVGAEVEIGYIRRRREETKTVKLGELDTGREEEDREPLPDYPQAANGLGVALAPIDEAARRRHNITSDIEGALVDAVAPGGPSFGKLKKGDVIVEIGFDAIESSRAALRRLEEAAEKSEDVLLIRVYRQGRHAFFSILRED
ncbi:MAG: Do family serine endopeptidase [Pseudomonadota bacterium]